MEAGGAADDLDVLRLRPVLERQVIVRKGTNDVQEQPARQHDWLCSALDLRVELHPQAELHVRRLQLHPAGLFTDQDTRQRLDRAARRYAARRDAQSSEERVTGYRQLHLIK